MNGEPTYNYWSLEEQGNISVLTSMSRVNTECRALRLNKDEYVNTTTGKICSYEHHDKRTENKKSLLRSFASLRALINTNATEPEKIRWATLTYAENMTDPERLYRDFKKFWQRLVYWHEKNELPKPEYIMVAEPQERGAWHCHVLLIYPVKAPYIANSTLAKKWGHGFTKITAVREDVDNLGAYLSAYLTDIAIDRVDGVPVKEIDGVAKSVIKGGRLDLYPTAMKLYRTSKGIKKPTKTRLNRVEAERYRQQHNQTYETVNEYKDEETNFETTIRKEWFNDTKADGSGGSRKGKGTERLTRHDRWQKGIKGR